MMNNQEKIINFIEEKSSFKKGINKHNSKSRNKKINPTIK